MAIRYSIRRMFSISIRSMLTAMLIFVLLSLVTASCATQNKHKKIKAVPCPCEKVQKRR